MEKKVANDALGALERGIVTPETGNKPMAAAPAGEKCLVARLLLKGKLIRTVTLRETRIVLGRDPTVDIPLEHSKVSRHHAELTRDAMAKWWLTDLGSRNHTMINDEEINTRTAVGAGDVIRIDPFAIELVHGTADGVDVKKVEDNVELSDSEPESISELKSPARLTAEHIATLYDFGHQLLTLEAPGERRSSLCRFLIQDTFRGRAATVLRVMRNDPGGVPRVMCTTESTADWRGQALYVSRSVMRAVVQREKPILASNVTDRVPEAIELSLGGGAMAMAVIAVPLHMDAETMDVLYMVLPPDCASVDWLALATIATQQYRHAQAAWAARELSEANAAVETELAQARQLQFRLVPQGLHVRGTEFAVGFRPCRSVGGDYVDALNMSDGKTLLVIADVCGKGLPAALIAFSLHTIVHTAVHREAGIADLTAELNAYLRQTLPDGRFVTFLAIMLDPKNGQIEYVNAGHPPGLIVGRDGRGREIGSVSNLPLGIAQEEMEISTETLASGELIALYTDGLTELAVKPTVMLGTKNLSRNIRHLYRDHGELTLPQLASHLSAMLDKLQDGVSQDDRTFLLARRATNE